ncbi:MAG: GAF domain-containing protein [Acidobacteria bacterium]|nr:GAF domain-containing protein [Acidobacteriota bacterium]
MGVHSSLDFESFHSLLASAFVVQEALSDFGLRSSTLDILRLIRAREIDVTNAMHRVADRARNVGNASGVAVAVLNGDRLVYRAGSGSAASYVGQHLMATLSVSAKPETEILRVEDAQTDSRIGGAICRQFGARSLLILPIYHARRLAGILEVFFSAPHLFQDREVCAYQLLARVVGEAIAHDALVEQKHTVGAETSSQKLPPQTPNSAVATTIIPPPRPSVPLYLRLWRVADRVAIITVLVIASWIAYSYRRTTSSFGIASVPKSSMEQESPVTPAKAAKDYSKSQPAGSLESKAIQRMPHRVRVGSNVIDYVSEDVTVRHFSSKPTLKQVRAGDYEVDDISDDVTVRHFIPKFADLPPKN